MSGLGKFLSAKMTHHPDGGLSLTQKSVAPMSNLQMVTYGPVCGPTGIWTVHTWSTFLCSSLTFEKRLSSTMAAETLNFGPEWWVAQALAHGKKLGQWGRAMWTSFSLLSFCA